MHEVGMMSDVLAIAEDVARKHGASCIHRLQLRVGPLAGVAIEALHCAFAALSPGTLAASAELEIANADVSCQCHTCGSQFTPDTNYFVCPSCGTASNAVVGGSEFILESLEVS